MPPADSTTERRSNSTAALLILQKIFRFISSLPFNFCSMFLSKHNFTPNPFFRDSEGEIVVSCSMIGWTLTAYLVMLLPLSCT